MLNILEDISYFRKHIVPLFLIIVSIALVYSNSLKGSFQLDDTQVFVRPNLHLSTLSIKSLSGTFYFTPQKQKIYRPIPCLTLGLNYYFGKENVFGYHVVNIGIHILCSIAVYTFLHILLSIPGIKPKIASQYRHEIATIAAFMFALHPIQTNVATYIIQRMTSMASFFYIVSFTGYIRFRLGTLPGYDQTRLKTSVSLFICLSSALLAILSKENTATLPVIIFFADVLLFYRLSNKNDRRKARRIYVIISVLILVVIAYEAPKYFFQSIELYKTRDFTPIERLLTEARIIFFYLYLLIIPNIGLLNLNHDFSLSTGLFSSPQTLISIVGIILFLFLAYRFRKKHNLISFAIVWYLGNLAIESTFFPLELIFEHRTYLPGVLVFCLMALAIVTIGHRINNVKAMVIFTSIMLIFYSSATILRNNQFKSKFSLWWDAVEKSPNSARAHVYLGNAYTGLGYIEKGKHEYKVALNIKPDMPEAVMNVGSYYKRTGNLHRAELSFRRVLTLNPHTKLYLICIALSTIADINGINGEYVKAVHYYKAALRRVPFYGEAIHNLAITKIHLGEKKAAENIFLHGMRIDPGYQDFYTSLAKLYANEKKYPAAINILSTYLSRNKNSKKVIWLLENIKKKSETKLRPD